MAQISSVVSSKAAMVANWFGIQIPAGGFDADSWQAVIDAFFPVLEESVMLLDLLIESAPQDCDPEMLSLLQEYAAAYTSQPREVSFA